MKDGIPYAIGGEVSDGDQFVMVWEHDELVWSAVYKCMGGDRYLVYSKAVDEFVEDSNPFKHGNRENYFIIRLNSEESK